MGTFYCADCEPSCSGHGWNEKDIHPDPSRFKAPNVYATYVPSRSSNSRFKTHSSPGMVKSSIRSSRGNQQTGTSYAYEWDAELATWVETAEFPPGVDLRTHPYFVKKHTLKPVKVSEKAVDKAIASIMGGT